MRPLIATAAAGLLLASLAGCAEELPQDVLADARQWKTLRAELEAGASAVGGAAVQKAEPTGWATVRGTVRIDGNAPALPPLLVDKDQQICGSSVPNEQLVINNGSIQNVLVFLDLDLEDDSASDAPKWVHPSYAETREAALEYDQKNCVFLSHVLAMRTTQSLKILNSDPTGHNTNIQPTRAAPFNQTIPANTGAAAAPTYSPGAEASQPFPVSCSIHPWMTAFIISRDNPYFAVTDENGNFEIANLPAGIPLKFRVWQERAGFLKSATVNGQAENWSGGRLARTLNPDEALELTMELDAAAFR